MKLMIGAQEKLKHLTSKLNIVLSNIVCNKVNVEMTYEKNKKMKFFKEGITMDHTIQ